MPEPESPPAADDVTLLIPRWIAPVVPDAALADHAVVVRGQRIDAVLPAQQAIGRHPHATRVALDRHLLIPGLVNLHTHAAMTLLRGAGDDLPLERWLNERIWPLEHRLVSERFVHDGTVLACHEMLRAGITCFGEMYFFPEAAVQAALEMGMRIAAGIVVFDFPSPYGTGPADYLSKGLALRDRMRGEPLASFTLAPHAPYTVSDPWLREIAKLAAELQLPVHTHVHETAGEIARSLQEHGRRPIDRLADLGLLGPELIAVHAVHLSDADLQRLAQHGASVAHCPHSNLKLGSGIAPLARMLRAGINVGIGTDGAASNNRLDLISEMRTAALLAKGHAADPALLSAHQALHAATLGGATALGLQRSIGSIEPGKYADLVAVDLSDVDLAPIHDPVSTLVHAAGREHVDTVWVAGRVVAVKRQMQQQSAIRTLSDVLARSTMWHNRIGQIVPGTA